MKTNKISKLLVNNILYICLLLMIAAIAVASPSFLSLRVLSDVMIQSAPKILLAMGMPPIVIRAQDHAAYHAALDVFHLEGDLSPFRRFLRNETLLTWEGLLGD